MPLKLPPLSLSSLQTQIGYSPSNQETPSYTGTTEETDPTVERIARAIAGDVVARTGVLNLVKPPNYIPCGNLPEKYTPRPYQMEGINYLWEGKRRFLTDKPGLGKTLQAAAAAEAPVLIACPTYLVDHWEAFLKELGHNPTVPRGDRARKQEALNRAGAWTVINIEMLRDYEIKCPKTLIIDEAHHLRGKDSQQSKGALAIAKNKVCERVYLLTATPAFNHPDDLFAQFRLLYPDVYTSYWKFINEYCITVEQGFGPKIIGARPSLKRVFNSMALGRTYKDVDMELPRLVGQKIVIEPNDDFRKKYKSLRDFYTQEKDGQTEVFENPLQVLQKLRKLTGGPKLQPLLKLMQDTDGFSGSVIFCWYKETAHAIADLLEIPCVTGELPPRERVKLAKSSNCIVATIESLAEGVDLSHLHTVVFYELDYVPGKLFQALSRVRRHGGHEVVRVYYLLVKQTIDEILYTVDEKRTATINSIVREALS